METSVGFTSIGFTSIGFTSSGKLGDSKRRRKSDISYTETFKVKLDHEMGG